MAKFEFRAGDIIIAFSTIIAPLAALQIQTYIEKIKMRDAKKMEVFKILMATRNTPLNYRHVEAINMVSVEFYGDVNVINSLKKYLEVRKPKQIQEDISKGHVELVSNPLVNSLIELLQAMAISLNLNFYEDEIRNGCYRPQRHVDLENMQAMSAINLAQAVKDGKVHVVIERSLLEKSTDV